MTLSRSERQNLSHLLSVIEAAAAPASAERASLEAFEAVMDALAEGLDDVLVPAPEALTREAICGHHWIPPPRH